MLRMEAKHYTDTSGLSYSYNEFYTQNMPDKAVWKLLQSGICSQICRKLMAERGRRTFP